MVKQAAMILFITLSLFSQNLLAENDFELGEVIIPNIFLEEIEKFDLFESRGPAPALSYLEIYAIGSSNYNGWEYVSEGQYSTTYDHGGTTMNAITLELGYGYVPVATMNGGQLPSAASYRSDSLCWGSDGNLDYCSSGETIAGWLKYWDISGQEGGTFTYQNTSFNPTNTMSDTINIK